MTATAATAALPLVTGSHQRRAPRPRIDGQPNRWTALEQSHNLGTQFLPGVSDGPITFIRSESSWQNGQMMVFQSHANGHSYRHHGNTLNNLAPGVWVHGPDESQRYSTITSVVRGSDGSLYGFTHNETPGDIASIGVVKSDENGYEWDRLINTAVVGQDLQTQGFRGATGPNVVERDGKYHMFYGNRFGWGRHGEVWTAEADHPEGDWEVKGPVIVETGDHYFAEGSTVVWSKPNNRWMMIYSTDKATRYALSKNLRDWSSPRTFLSKPGQWVQTEGHWRWYGCLLDETQDSSMVIGRNAKLAEHWVELKGHREPDYALRYPMLTDMKIR